MMANPVCHQLSSSGALPISLFIGQHAILIIAPLSITRCFPKSLSLDFRTKNNNCFSFSNYYMHLSQTVQYAKPFVCFSAVVYFNHSCIVLHMYYISTLSSALWMVVTLDWTNDMTTHDQLRLIWSSKHWLLLTSHCNLAASSEKLLKMA